MQSKHDEDILGIYTAVQSAAKKGPWPTQRRHVRLKVDLRVKVHFSTAGIRTFILGQGNDVSEGGMACYIPTDLYVGDRVDIEVVLPYGRRPIVITAEVRNRNSFRYGLEFIGIQEADRAVLLRSLTALSKAQ
jgi:c-di-GMP-binding flagellar brake protein YcgR